MAQDKMSRVIPVFIALNKEMTQRPPLTPVRYDVSLSTFPDSRYIDVQVNLTVRAPSGTGPTIRMYLGIPGMNVFHIRSARADGDAAEYRYRSPHLDLRLPAPLKSGGIVRVDLAYRGSVSSPKNYVGVQGTELMGEGLWLPAVCFPGPRFDMSIVTDVPAGEVTAAPGRPVSTRTEAGRTITKWKSDVPISSHTVVSGPFLVSNRSVGATTVQVLVQRGYESSADDLSLSATAVLRTGEEWFGRLPLSHIYLVQPRRPRYGEYAHMPFIVYAKTNLAKSPDPASRMKLFEATAHELGHFWWGNIVSSDPVSEGWLSEGFADFTKVLALEQAFGRPEALRMLENMCAVVKKQGQVPPLAVIDMSHPNQGQIVRRQGGLFLEATREKYGDGNMKALLHRIYEDFKDRAVTTRDFIAAAVACFPGPGVEAFMQEHLYGTPRYEIQEGQVVTK
ncbi:MAG: M1 family metallopeptidase [Bacillota bacterium]